MGSFTTVHLKVARMALAGALVCGGVGYGCAPIAPSLEKSRFDGSGTSVPGGIPLDGNVYQTQISASDPSPPSQNRIVLETTTVNEFRASSQVQLLLGSLPPGGIRGIFVVTLPSTAVSSLQEFRTEMFETATGSGIWVLRVKSNVNASISQMVRDHLDKIYLEFAVEDQATASSDETDETEVTGETTEPEDSVTTEPQTDPEADTPTDPSESTSTGDDQP